MFAALQRRSLGSSVALFLYGKTENPTMPIPPLPPPGAGARQLELSGLVLTRSCNPLRGAVVDLWHADERGEYDNVGFQYRGHVLTGPDGVFRFGTIVPAIYFGRTRHYHVKVQAPGSYFPNEPASSPHGSNIGHRTGLCQPWKGCLLWVKSRHRRAFRQCPLYPQKRTSVAAVPELNKRALYPSSNVVTP